MKQSLENRMKCYEQGTCPPLPENIPIILRLDGRAFHMLTRGLKKPYDHDFIEMMNAVAMDLCDNEIQNAKMAYLQSDEISILIYKKVMSDSWFKNDVQKMTSISASRASSFAIRYDQEHKKIFPCKNIIFDSRVFVIPEMDVCNYFIWRQRDWERNSIQMLARKYYSQGQLHLKSILEMHDMIFKQGDNWNDRDVMLKRGRCIVPSTKKIHVTKEQTKGHFEGAVDRTIWVVDSEIPIFTQKREYINKFLKREVQNEKSEAIQDS